MLIDAFERAFASAKKKGWDKIYIAVDVHDTMVYGNYNATELPRSFTPGAEETMRILSDRPDVDLIMYTCSHQKEIDKYLKYFAEHGIVFQDWNKNVDVPDNALGCYQHKLYFNILLEDKAGFDCEKDWFVIKEWIQNRELLCQK